MIAAQPRSTDIVLEPSTAWLSRERGCRAAPPQRNRSSSPCEAVASSKSRSLRRCDADFPFGTRPPANGDLDEPAVFLQGGVDQFAAVRHLRAALAKLLPGGRVVAIMPDWFTTSAKMLRIYEETFANCTVQTSCRLAKCYHKQGTSVAVRLLVIDKVPGNSKPSLIARDTVSELAECFLIVKRIDPATAPPARPTRIKPKATSLFKSMRASRAHFKIDKLRRARSSRWTMPSWKRPARRGAIGRLRSYR